MNINFIITNLTDKLRKKIRKSYLTHLSIMQILKHSEKYPAQETRTNREKA